MEDTGGKLHGYEIKYGKSKEIDARILFRPEVARYVKETRWHASQRNQPQPDGSLVVEMHLSGTRELKSWLLSFGRHAEVLAPPELRAEMREELQQAHEAYGEPISGGSPEIKTPVGESQA